MEKTNTKQVYIAGAILVVLIVIVGWLLISRNNTNTADSTATSTPLSLASSTDTGIMTEVTGSTTTVAASASTQNTEATFDNLIAVGAADKTAGDYSDAAAAWQKASTLSPSNLVSFADLADLYTNFLKNYPQAEVNYTTAIKNNPTEIDLYRNAYNLYIMENKNVNAVAILKQGIAANPNTFDLQIILARYYRGIADPLDAKAYYGQAISIAQSQGNTSVAVSLSTEEAAM